MLLVTERGGTGGGLIGDRPGCGAVTAAAGY